MTGRGSISPLAFAHQPRDAQDVLEVMDEALEDHRHWLSAWHKGIICRLEPAEDMVADKPHLRTRLGAWLDEFRDSGLMRQPVFHELEKSFADLHHFAAFLINRAGDGQAVPPEEYDAFAEKEERFILNARRIQDAFRKAIAELDPLTGLQNRQVMYQELKVEYERSIRTGSPCCIALADIDFFKKVNDTYGHLAGDHVLGVTADRLLSQLRGYDSIYRYGGEEFLIVLPNASPDMAVIVVERLRLAMADAPVELPDGQELPVTSSFGLAMVEQGVPVKDVIERADLALYYSKENGRNRVTVWSKDLKQNG